MIIKSIVKLRNNKYKIVFDDCSIVTYDSVILENNLLYKKVLEDKLYKRIINDTKYYDAYNSTVQYITKKIRSEKEIVKYLSKFELSKEEKDKIINKLKELNLINDNIFCMAYINDKVNLTNDGINKIKQDLTKYNIQNSIIEKNIKSIDSDIIDKKLEKLITKKMNTNSKYSNYYMKQKVLNDMINLGYNREDILRVIYKYTNSDDDILEREFDKIYFKYKNVYSGYELKNKIIKKLATRGFSIDRINDLINKKEAEN